ncbi:OprD family outer membrane porin [Pseudomonas asplenii]|uniref:OprD family outer membrane porin n=1 Tax=Pseudomonas asplenii TaxID=53407 RepID=UPI0003723FE7|nr:OprD family outer membrane porin [Pseudomonas fuscovaginae]
MHNKNKMGCELLAVTPCLAAATAYGDGFIDDSKVTLQTTNVYINRDLRDGAGQSKHRSML